MSRSKPFRRLYLAAVVLTGVRLLSAQPDRPVRLWDHGTHTQPSPEERSLRELLARYQRGEIDVVVRAILPNPPQWIPKAVDSAVRRIDEEIKYHRRSENRLSAARDERLERYLRADRLQVLLLAAGMQLEASRAASGVDVAGSNLIASERTIDALYTLRRDFEQDGQVPWPLAIDEPWDVVVDPGVGRRSADWPAVRAFIRRWYSAAVATLQYRVELRLAPALVARGLARFPDDPTLLVARGSLVETSLALAQVDDSLAATLYSVETRQRWRDELANAERDFERAERAGDRSTEAGVRLARVRLLTGERESARATLDRVLAAAAPVVVRYLALLFRAAAAEQAGDARAAIQDYDAAADIWPGAQTPLLALGRIADESHRPADARNYVQRALAAKAGSGDPWRGYILGQAWQLDARLASLRTLEPH